MEPIKEPFEQFMKLLSEEHAAATLHQAALSHYMHRYIFDAEDNRDPLVLQGAYLADLGRGFVNIFRQRSVEGKMTPLFMLKGDESKPGDRFGYSFDASDFGKYIAVGAPGEGVKNYSGRKCGRVYLFKRSGDNWVQTSKTWDSTNIDGMGHRLTMSRDGEYIVTSNVMSYDKPNHIRLYVLRNSQDDLLLEHSIDYTHTEETPISILGLDILQHLEKAEEVVVRTNIGRFYFSIQTGKLVEK